MDPFAGYLIAAFTFVMGLALMTWGALILRRRR